MRCQCTECSRNSNTQHRANQTRLFCVLCRTERESRKIALPHIAAIHFGLSNINMRDFLVLWCAYIYFFSVSVVVCWCCCFLVPCDDSCTNECRYEYVHNIKTGIHTHACTWANEWAQHSMGEEIHVKHIASSTEMDLGWVSQCSKHGVRFNAVCLWICTNTTTCWLCAFAAFVYAVNTWMRSFECRRSVLETRILFNEFVFPHTTHSSEVRKS